MGSKSEDKHTWKLQNWPLRKVIEVLFEDWRFYLLFAPLMWLSVEAYKVSYQFGSDLPKFKFGFNEVVAF